MWPSVRNKCPLISPRFMKQGDQSLPRPNWGGRDPAPGCGHWSLGAGRALGPPSVSVQAAGPQLRQLSCGTREWAFVIQSLGCRDGNLLTGAQCVFHLAVPSPAGPSCPERGRASPVMRWVLSHAEPAHFIFGDLRWTLAISFYELSVFLLSGTTGFAHFSMLSFLIPRLICLFLRSMWLGALGELWSVSCVLCQECKEQPSGGNGRLCLRVTWN